MNEQREYKEEGIEWHFVEFSSNQDCLDLIDSKPKGIFSMLDDECVVPQGRFVIFFIISFKIVSRKRQQVRE